MAQAFKGTLLLDQDRERHRGLIFDNSLAKKDVRDVVLIILIHLVLHPLKKVSVLIGQDNGLNYFRT